MSALRPEWVNELVAEYIGSTLLRRYVHGAGTDEPLVWYEGAGLSDRRWLHADHQGSVVATSDETGEGTVYAYSAYGEPAYDDWGGSRFRYTGQIMLPEVKLYHYKARVYDPLLGRFLQTDPVGYADDLNLYAYVGNDPLDNADPTGETSRVVVDEATHTITITVPVSVGPGHSFSKISQAVAGTSQTITDSNGQQWNVQVSATEGSLVNEQGRRCTNFTNNDPNGDPREGNREDRRTGSGFVRLNAAAPNKTIAHELVGHGSGLGDEYNQATLQPNPDLPHNLMNNDDFSDTGMKLNGTQLSRIVSPDSGNDIIKGAPSLWRRFRDWIGL